jgi:uncharacterized protein
VTAFGAFVDIGEHQDGLVHISELADRFVKDPAEVVQVQQKVQVTVLDVDLARKRISLSMKATPGASGKKPGKSEDKKPGPSGKKPRPAERKKEQRNVPFNNPFAELLKRQ